MKQPNEQGRPNWPKHGRSRARRAAARNRALVYTFEAAVYLFGTDGIKPFRNGWVRA